MTIKYPAISPKVFTFKFALLCFLLLNITGCATCKYSTKDTAPIPPEVKTFRVNYFENKARYVNPQITPQITEKLKQKIISQTRLRQTNSDDAHYDISGYLSDYSVTTTGIANQNASTNRLNVTFHLVFKNTLDSKKDFESDVTSNYDFKADLTLPQAESQLGDEIVKNVTDAIFNKIFSNW
ncbi:MAG: LPS assembly lipoprotein LptE [Bacteroidota bacterium]|nr:LPS assembly lipoprotein LptE [Bacteroidota bacterium]